MRSVSETWAELAANGNFRFDVKLVIDGVEYTKTTAPRVSRPLFNAPLSVGSCMSATLGVSILTEDTIPGGAAVEIMGRLTNGTAETVCSEWKSFGTFYISKVDDRAARGLVILEAYDAMLKANAPAFTDLEDDVETQTMREAVQSIAASLGVAVDARTVINEGDDYIVPVDRTLTQRQVLGYIGGCHGGNWVITEEQELRLVPLVTATPSDEDTVHSVPAVMGDLTVSDTVAIGGVKMSDASGYEYSAGGTDGHVLTIEENPYASERICRDLFYAYGGLVYAPYTATKSLYNPAIEPGDHIAIGTKVTSIIGSQELKLDHAFRADISVPTSEELSNTYPYADPEMQQVRHEITKAKAEIKKTTDSIELRVSDTEGNVSSIQQTVDGINLTVTEQVGEDGQVYAQISLGIGPNKYSGYIKMTGNLDVSGQISADALYANLGDIADLTVNRVSTSRRIIRYLANDMTDDDFVRIEGEKIEFVTGTTDGSTVQATLPSGLLIYWEADVSTADIASNGWPYIDGQRIFTTTAETPWPVYVYDYTEFVKRSTFFTPINGINSTVDTFGEGDTSGNNRGWIVKDSNSMKFIYRDGAGNDIGLSMSYEGFLDVFGLRRTSFMDFSEWHYGRFFETLEGKADEIEYGVEFDDKGRPVKITQGDHSMEVRWWQG